MAQLKGDIPPVLPAPLAKQNGEFRNVFIMIFSLKFKCL